MSILHKRYDVGFKAKVTLEAIRGARTIPEIAIEYGVPANQITKWKKQVIDELPSILAGEAEKEDRTPHDLIFQLYDEIAKLCGELGRVRKAEAGTQSGSQVEGLPVRG
jgi:transposase-like protein